MILKYNFVINRLYNNLKTPSAITPPSDYSVFKEGIMPIWEDKQNIDGGRWLMIFPRIGGMSSVKCHEDLDRVWLELVSIVIFFLYTKTSNFNVAFMSHW